MARRLYFTMFFLVCCHRFKIVEPTSYTLKYLKSRTKYNLFRFFGTESLCSSGCLGTLSVDQGLQPRDPPASAPRVLGLKVRATTAQHIRVLPACTVCCLVPWEPAEGARSPGTEPSSEPWFPLSSSRSCDNEAWAPMLTASGREVYLW